MTPTNGLQNGPPKDHKLMAYGPQLMMGWGGENHGGAAAAVLSVFLDDMYFHDLTICQYSDLGLLSSHC